MKPKLLDLFCGAGGAAMGYHRAGFDVHGVDCVPQPHYPFTFHQGDAMTWPLDGFDVIHASPPCQDHSSLATMHDSHGTGWMLAGTIERLAATGLPYIVENVPGARGEMGGAVVSVCGSALGCVTTHPDEGEVWLKRHRLFASNAALLVPPCACKGKKIIGVYGHGDGARLEGRRGWKGNFRDRKAVMGIDWMNRAELAQAIPPAYTEYLGRQLLAYVEAAA